MKDKSATKDLITVKKVIVFTLVGVGIGSTLALLEWLTPKIKQEMQ